VTTLKRILSKIAFWKAQVKGNFVVYLSDTQRGNSQCLVHYGAGDVLLSDLRNIHGQLRVAGTTLKVHLGGAPLLPVDPAT